MMKLSIVAFALLDPLNTVAAEVYYSSGPSNSVRVDTGLLCNEMINCAFETEPSDYAGVQRHFGLNRFIFTNKIHSTGSATRIVKISDSAF